MNYEEESDSDVFSDIEIDKCKLREELTVWKKGGWCFDPLAKTGHHLYVPRLNMNGSTEILSEISYFVHFLPANYFKKTVLLEMNENISNTVKFDELLCFLGMFYSMEVPDVLQYK